MSNNETSAKKQIVARLVFWISQKNAYMICNFVAIFQCFIKQSMVMDVRVANEKTKIFWDRAIFIAILIGRLLDAELS